MESGKERGSLCSAQHFSNWKMLKGSFPWRPPIWLQTKPNSALPGRAEVFIPLVKGEVSRRRKPRRSKTTCPPSWERACSLQSIKTIKRGGLTYSAPCRYRVSYSEVLGRHPATSGPYFASFCLCWNLPLFYPKRQLSGLSGFWGLQWAPATG